MTVTGVDQAINDVFVPGLVSAEWKEYGKVWLYCLQFANQDSRDAYMENAENKK